MFWKKKANHESPLLDLLRDFTADDDDLEGSLLLPEQTLQGNLKELAGAVNARIGAAMDLAARESDKLHMVNRIINSGMWTMYSIHTLEPV